MRSPSCWVWQTPAAWGAFPSSGGPRCVGREKRPVVSRLQTLQVPGHGPHQPLTSQEGSLQRDKEPTGKGLVPVSFLLTGSRPLHNILQHHSHSLNNTPRPNIESYPGWTQTGKRRHFLLGFRRRVSFHVMGVTGLQKWLPSYLSYSHPRVVPCPVTHF